MASERPNSPPVVVLDANLLYPFQLRNLLVQFGVDGVISPRWSARIHEEWIRNLVEAGRAPLDRLRRTRDLMDRALPDADVKGWKQHMDGLVLPDPDDRHVLAAALAGGAGIILTMNLRDFPAPVMVTYEVRAVHPDGFLCDLHACDPELVRASAEAAHANLSRSTPSFADYLEALDRQGLPALAQRLRA